MAQLDYLALDGVLSDLAETSIRNGLPRLHALHQYQESIMKDHPETAAFLDIYESMSGTYRPFISDMFEGKSNPNPRPEDKFPKENRMFDNSDAMIERAANNAYPGTIQNTAHKDRHIALIKMGVRAIRTEGTTGKYRDIRDGLPEVIKRLYGYWGKTFDSGGPVKVALPYKLTNGKQEGSGWNVGQNEWELSLEYTYARAEYLWGPDLSLVAREGIALGVKGYFKGNEEDEFEKGIEIKVDPNEVDKNKLLGTNRYNPDWNIIQKQFVDVAGGNIWVSRINDPQDPSRIRLVIMAGNRDYPTDVQIVGDLYRIDENTGESIPVTFSAEEMVQLMASNQAYQLMDSDDDWWDWADPITWVSRAFRAEYTDEGHLRDYLLEGGMWGTKSDTGRSYSDKKDISTGEERTRWTERGGDFGRENIDYYHNKYSKDVPGSDYDKLQANAIGGKYLTEWSDPGRVEMDMYIDPLWKEIQILEKSKSEELGRPYQINDGEFKLLYQLHKSRLNGGTGWFSSETPMTYFDRLANRKPQNSLELLRSMKFRLQSIFEAMHD